ncbi:hypothetical protein [Flavivirga sp. 57AJ16]|uniref:hypothetical protein n=1 Tax=Flavivirga sp. 57AJ16 TaxID=3025307 RepID=UPI002367200A|nr:hypothetical protein [Flavivirga sp. 57AJ16]MDD7885845.1 hypothetical protein [Flavivirga sp. 57AJ16]
MKIFIAKTLLYSLLIFVFLEGLTRIFHLYQQYPASRINDLNVEVNTPNQKGYYVTGNRRMNFAKFNINSSGFNSYREFTPTKETNEIALIGDSFIEGLHQDYFNSIGRKVENRLDDGTEVYEYGYSGYDLADQLHLISAYKEKFELIDHIIIYIKFHNDLKRDTYIPNQYRVDLQYSTSFQIRDKVKLIAYADGIGIFEPFRNLKNKIFGQKTKAENEISHILSEKESKEYLENFKKLIETYGFDKNKTVFLLDKEKTSKLFTNYCEQMGYDYIDFGSNLERSKTPTTLIYDQHWNNHGRNIIANVISDYIRKKND